MDTILTPPEDVLAIDAEWSETQLLCVGFSYKPNFSFTIPTTIEYWGNAPKLKRAINWVKRYCENDIPKVLQHGHSDAYILKWFHDININNYKWDTLAMHHILDPNAPHDLAYLTSIYTREPYYKDEAKDPEKIARYASNFDALLTYNGKDACVTREIFDVLYAELAARGLLDFYKEHYEEMFPAIIDLQLQGIKVDDKRRRVRHAQVQAKVIQLQDEMTKIVGEQVFAKKSLKGPVVQRYFYDTLKLPKIMRTRKRKGGEKVKTPSVDEVAIRRMMLKHESAKEFGKLVLDHRRNYQLMTFYG